jgi:hypothetical protein
MGVWGSIKKTLFGEKPSIEQTSTLTPEQQALLKKLGVTLEGQVGKGVDAYEGQMYAGPSGLNQTVFNYLNQVMSGTDSSTSRANSAIDTMMAKYTDPIEEKLFDPSYINSYFESGVKAPAMRDFTETVLPGIAEKYASKNAIRSGAMTREMMDAATNLETNLAGQLSNLLFQGSESHATRELQRKLGMEGISSTAMNQIIQLLMKQPLDTLVTALPIAQQEQTFAQDPLTEAFSKWQMSQAYNNPWLQYLSPALGVDAIQNIVKPGSEGLLPTLIQAGAKVGAAMI